MNTTFFWRGFFVLLVVLCPAQAWADGKITHFSGEVSVQKADGTILPGAAGVKVLESDTLITGGKGYARLEMSDGGEMVLRPNSQLKIETYRFNSGKPAEDTSVFNMLKGGLRTVTGLIGKRGNKDAYELKTNSATVGIRGTQFDMRVCQADCGSLADGTYLAVRFGAVRTGNAQGSVDVAAGQVALVQQSKPPVMLPRDPGIGFTPPAVIPKLDEKKKVQAAAAEEAKTEKGKAAENSKEKSSKSSSENGDKKESDDKKGGSDDKKESGDKKNADDKKDSKASDGKNATDKSDSGDSKEKGGADTVKKSAPDTGEKTGSATNKSGDASPGSTAAPAPAPAPQATHVVECSVQ